MILGRVAEDSCRPVLWRLYRGLGSQARDTNVIRVIQGGRREQVEGCVPCPRRVEVAQDLSSRVEPLVAELARCWSLRYSVQVRSNEKDKKEGLRVKQLG